jgi:hypothetical protein
MTRREGEQDETEVEELGMVGLLIAYFGRRPIRPILWFQDVVIIHVVAFPLWTEEVFGITLED